MVMACILALHKSMIGVFFGKDSLPFEFLLVYTLFSSKLQKIHASVDEGGQWKGQLGHALEGRGPRLSTSTARVLLCEEMR